MTTANWPDASFTRTFTAAAGTCPGGGVDKTVMAVFKPNATGFSPINARLGTTLVWGFYLDSGQMFFGTSDFHGGPNRVAGEWLQAAARFTGSNHNVNWRYRTTTGGGAAWGTWSNIVDYSTGEGGTTIDNLFMGQTFGDLSNGLEAAAGVWNTKLSDSAIDALDVNIPSWRASAAVCYQFNGITSPPVAGNIVDITGNGANGTNYSTASGDVLSSATDPPGIVYYTPGGNTPPSSAFFQFLGA